MKKLIVALTVSLTCLGAFAQGKVNFINNSLHLMYFTTDTTQLDPLDVGLAGASTPSNGKGSLNPATTLMVDLYAGTSAGTLSRVATSTITTGGTPGTWNGVNVSMTPGGTGFNGVTAVPAGTDFFQVQVYDSSVANYAAASGANGKYYGQSTIFQSNASAVAQYYSIVQLVSPAFSQWAVGTQNEDATIVGGKGAIQIQMNNTPTPEPTSFALAGLGAAAMLIFRRRK